MNTDFATFNPDTDNLDALRARLDGAASRARAAEPRVGDQGHNIRASVASVEIKNGQITSNTTVKDGTATAYATPTRPGMITIPGVGETSIAAAKAGGLIPHTYQEGQPSPFADPRGAAHGGTEKAAQEAPVESPKVSAAQHIAEQRAKAAGDILSGVDQAHGPQVTDHLLNAAVDTGDIPNADALPEGVTPEMAQKVMTGYLAQADNALAAVGASVSLLQEFCTDDELRQARRATVNNTPEEMHRLGKLAVDRLAKLPETDPEGFREMIDGMSPAERKCIRQDRHSKQWRVNVPGFPETTFGAAVQLGLIRV